MQWSTVFKKYEQHKQYYSKWFEPRSISGLSSVIIRVSVVLKRAAEHYLQTITESAGTQLNALSTVLTTTNDWL